MNEPVNKYKSCEYCKRRYYTAEKLSRYCSQTCRQFMFHYRRGKLDDEHRAAWIAEAERHNAGKDM